MYKILENVMNIDGHCSFMFYGPFKDAVIRKIGIFLRNQQWIVLMDILGYVKHRTSYLHPFAPIVIILITYTTLLQSIKNANSPKSQGLVINRTNLDQLD